MILRRVIENVKAQNWFAVAIDFVIVVVGVFIGIQVSNWNAANADRRIAEKYLVDIADDVRSDLIELSRVRDSAMVRIGASAYVLREAGVSSLAPDYALSQSNAEDVFSGSERIGIPEAEAPPTEQRNRLWSLATGVYVYDTNRSAYDALISSGKIELIGDAGIMRALREYHYLVTALYETQGRTILPLRQHIIETGIERGFSPKGVVEESVLIDQMRSDAVLAASLAASREYAGLHLLICRLLDKKAQELLRLIESRNA